MEATAQWNGEDAHPPQTSSKWLLAYQTQAVGTHHSTTYHEEKQPSVKLEKTEPENVNSFNQQQEDMTYFVWILASYML